ncbi:alpha-hydroxy-acid oxidizing protein [Cellulomonas fimi]|uniref:Alpha-hydroxy-acid oxidizing protein n=1 Tax=Cellulomonas fimi TaxID=1708 RepID=A0A7Y0M0E2_CELFI|nr:alpha-hydroxy-acid oxidizing protein [Cellulomonas fimi]
MIGRAYLYGLMAGGATGVERAIDLLREEIRVAMQLLGVTSVAELAPTRSGWTRGRHSLTRRAVPTRLRHARDGPEVPGYG